MKKYLVSGSAVLLGACLGFAGVSVSSAYSYPVLNLDSSLNQYLSLSNSNQDGLSITGDMTAECWVRLDSAVDSQTPGVMTKDNGQPNRSYSFGILRNGDVYSGSLQLSLDGTNENTQRVYIPMTGFATGTWNHVAWVYDASGGWLKLYTNGVLQGQRFGLPHSVNVSAADFDIGRYGPDGVYFNGQLDNCRLWNQKRSANQIANKMNELVVPDAEGLVGQWSFHRNLKDTSEYGNDMSPVNGASIQN